MICQLETEFSVMVWKCALLSLSIYLSHNPCFAKANQGWDAPRCHSCLKTAESRAVRYTLVPLLWPVQERPWTNSINNMCLFYNIPSLHMNIIHYSVGQLHCLTTRCYSILSDIKDVCSMITCVWLASRVASMCLSTRCLDTGQFPQQRNVQATKSGPRSELSLHIL